MVLVGKQCLILSHLLRAESPTNSDKYLMEEKV